MRLFFISFILIFWSFQISAQTNEISIEKLWGTNVGGANFGGVEADDVNIYSGAEDGILRAISKATGEVIWTFDAGAAIGSNAKVDDLRVYFHTRDGVVHAVSKADGKALWSFATEGERQWDYWDYYLSIPTVDDRQVYFGSGDHHVYALDKRTGNLRWKIKTGNIVHGEPAISGEKIIIGGFDGKMYAIDRGNGKILWTFKTVGNAYFRNGEIPGSATVKDGLVYFGGRDYNIYALLEETGTGAWNDMTPSWVVGRPLAIEEDLIVVNSDGSMVFSYNNRSGRENWQFKNSYNMFSAAVPVGTSHIAVAGLDGRITILERSTGEVASFYEGESTQAERSNFFDEGGGLDYSDVKSVEDLIDLYERQLAAMGGIPGSLVVDNDKIFFATAGGEIVAIKVNGIDFKSPEDVQGEN
ncbi:MAG: outer membrane protein assembly factor BamB family protein [Alphaproteobacteria bacterium]